MANQDLLTFTGWDDLPDEEDIIRAVGAATFDRGAVYAMEGRVRWIRNDPRGRILYAGVQGSGAGEYQTLVRVGSARRDGTTVTGSCTCPVRTSCKHVAAVALSALWGNDEPGADEPAPPPVPPWEQALAGVVRPSPPLGVHGTPVGLQLELVETTGRAARTRARIRPVVPGRSGRWVRTGVSWRQLVHSYGPDGHVAAHRAALAELYAAHGASTQYWNDQPVYLDEYGPALWPLLRRVVDAGVPLVPAGGCDGPVRLVEEPARLVVDVARGDGGDLAVTAVLHLPDSGTGRTQTRSILGEPAHGVVVTPTAADGTSGGTLLVPLDAPLSRQATALAQLGTLTVPARDADRFLHEYYPALRQLVPVRSLDESVDLPEIAPPALALRATYAVGHRLRLEWSFRYEVDGVPRHVPLDAGPEGRDAAAERRLVSGLRLPTDRLPQIREPGGTNLVPGVELNGIDAALFTADVLPALREQGVVVEVVGEPPEYRFSGSAPVIRVSATDSDDPDWFDLGVSVGLDGEDVPFQELFVALVRGESHLVLDSGTYFALDRPELDQLRRLIEEARAIEDREPHELRLSTYHAGLWDELRSLGVVEAQSRRWAHSVEHLLDGAQTEPPPVPSGLRAELRPYQVDGFRWLSFLWDAGLGGILADDMGLGKTVQALAVVCRAHEAGELTAPVLVVAPTSVVGNWAAEARRFAPGLDVRAVDQTVARGGRPLAEEIAGADVVVTSYALFRIDFSAYGELEWSGLLLDEAQFVKNHQARTYQCARKLRASFKLAITGTPLENTLMDLWSLLSIVAPGLYPDPKRFTETYRKPIERGTDPEPLASLRRRISPFIRRRTKEQVAADLPDKQEQVVRVQLNPRHEKIYQTHLQRERRKVLSLVDDLDKNRFTILKSLTLLRQLSLDPALVDDKYAAVGSSKADVFLEQLRDVVDGGHRALVFSQFTGFLGVIKARLDAEGITHCYLDGRTRNRAKRIEEFKTGTAPVFLISLKAGGFGLNLTEADYCFILDPWWNPAAEAQAVDRTHRIGQDKNVMVYRLVAEDTIEEKVLALQERKRRLFDEIVDDGGALSGALSSADIRALLVS